MMMVIDFFQSMTHAYWHYDDFLILPNDELKASLHKHGDSDLLFQSITPI